MTLWLLQIWCSTKVIAITKLKSEFFHLIHFIIPHILFRYDTAIQQYTSAIELQPEDTDFYKARADIYFELERNAEALQDVRTILALKPNNKEAMKLLKQIKNETKLGRWARLHIYFCLIVSHLNCRLCCYAIFLLY